jgi:hypothetical protein
VHAEVKKSSVKMTVPLPELRCEQLNDPVTASADKDIILTQKNNERLFDLKDNDCGDSLILKSGTSSRVQIFEVTETEILFKRCANLSGPMITIHKNDVARVRYATGNSETFENIKKNDLKKIVKGEKKFAPDTTSTVGLFFSFMFLVAWFTMILGIIIGLELLFFIGVFATIILFFIALIATAYAFYQIKTDPENHSGRSKIRLTLFILLFGALLTALPLIMFMLGKLVI